MTLFKKTPDLNYEIITTNQKLPVGGVKRLILRQDWNDKFVDIIRKKQIQSIVANYLDLSNGIEFLASLKGMGIRNFVLQMSKVKDVSPLIHLKDELECLSLEIDFTKAPDFTQFSKLWIVGTVWRASAKSILHSHTITHLGLDKYPFESLEVFSNMSQLESLSLGYGNLKSLKGIDDLPNLKELNIAFSRTLESLDGIQNATTLTKEKTVITRCKHITPESPFAEYVTFDDLV